MSGPKDKKNLTLAEKYKLKGAQQMTYDEYEAAKAKSARKSSKFKIPAFAKFILGTPFIIIFLFGVLFIPYIVYLIFTSPSAPPIKDETKNTNVVAR